MQLWVIYYAAERILFDQTKKMQAENYWFNDSKLKCNSDKVSCIDVSQESFIIPSAKIKYKILLNYTNKK